MHCYNFNNIIFKYNVDLIDSGIDKQQVEMHCSNLIHSPHIFTAKFAWTWGSQ